MADTSEKQEKKKEEEVQKHRHVHTQTVAPAREDVMNSPTSSSVGHTMKSMFKKMLRGALDALDEEDIDEEGEGEGEGDVEDLATTESLDSYESSSMIDNSFVVNSASGELMEEEHQYVANYMNRFKKRLATQTQKVHPQHTYHLRETANDLASNTEEDIVRLGLRVLNVCRIMLCKLNKYFEAFDYIRVLHHDDKIVLECPHYSRDRVFYGPKSVSTFVCLVTNTSTIPSDILKEVDDFVKDKSAEDCIVHLLDKFVDVASPLEDDRMRFRVNLRSELDRLTSLPRALGAPSAAKPSSEAHTPNVKAQSNAAVTPITARRHVTPSKRKADTHEEAEAEAEAEAEVDTEGVTETDRETKDKKR
jgi:hypothetical protein